MKFVILTFLCLGLSACLGTGQSREIYTADGQPLSFFASECLFSGHYVRVFEVEGRETLGCVDKMHQTVAVYSKGESN